jgi:hypothetical protein
LGFGRFAAFILFDPIIASTKSKRAIRMGRYLVKRGFQAGISPMAGSGHMAGTDTLLLERVKVGTERNGYLLGVMVITGRIISSSEIPPCWKLFLYSLSYSAYLVGYTK